MAIAILFSACQAIGQRVNRLPQDPLIQVYFNHNPKANYTDPYRQIKREGDNLEKSGRTGFRPGLKLRAGFKSVCTYCNEKYIQRGLLY